MDFHCENGLSRRKHLIWRNARPRNVVGLFKDNNLTKNYVLEICCWNELSTNETNWGFVTRRNCGVRRCFLFVIEALLFLCQPRIFIYFFSSQFILYSPVFFRFLSVVRIFYSTYFLCIHLIIVLQFAWFSQSLLLNVRPSSYPLR